MTQLGADSVFALHQMAGVILAIFLDKRSIALSAELSGDQLQALPFLPVSLKSTMLLQYLCLELVGEV